jgi:hypothetical protein
VTRRLPLACAFALLAGACTTGQPGRATTLNEARGASETWRTSHDELSLAMRAIGRQLQTAGLSPGRESFRGFLTTGARTTHKVQVPANSCATLIAIASRGVHDMDAALYSPEGDLLAVDSQPDAHPTMQVCTGAEPRELWYALQVYVGAGSFVVATFVGAQDSLESAAKLLGARPALARLGNPELDGPGRVSAFREGLQRRGFEPLQAPMRVQLARDQDIRIALRVKPGQCYTAAGFALDGLRDVNLRVLDDEGGEVARDESREEDASAQFCASRRAEYAAELRGVDGSGVALLMLFKAEAAAIGGHSGLWLGERPLARAATAPLDTALAAVAQRSSSDGFDRGRSLLSGQLVPGEVIAHPFALTAQRCARIYAVGGPGVRNLSLVAKDASGQTLASAEGHAETTYVHLCSAAPRAVDLQVHAAAGSGPFTLAAYEAPLSTIAPAGADERVGAALQQALMQARDAGYEPLPSFAAGPRRLDLDRAEPVSLELSAGSARCVRAYVLSSARSARAQLWVDGTPVDEPALEGQAARFCDGSDTRAAKPVELRLWSNAADRGDAWLIVLAR